MKEETYCERREEYFAQAMKSTGLFINGFSIFMLKVCSIMLFKRARGKHSFRSAIAENETFLSYLELNS